MRKNAINILLLYDIEDEVLEITKELYETMQVPFTVSHLNTLRNSLELLRTNEQGVDVVLLDVNSVCKHQCPEGVCNFVELISCDVPVVVITEKEDHELALFAINSGASDNISRSDFRGTRGKLRDAIEFSLARFSVLKLIEKEKHNGDIMIDQLVSYIGGGYSCSKLGDNYNVKCAAPCGHCYDKIEEKHGIMYATSYN